MTQKEVFQNTLRETESQYSKLTADRLKPCQPSCHASRYKEDFDKLSKIFSAIPKDLKGGESRILKCPICGNDTLNVSLSSYDDHLAVSCKCGIMMIG